MDTQHIRMRNGISQKQINQDREGPLERGSSPIYNCVKESLYCFAVSLSRHMPPAPSWGARLAVEGAFVINIKSIPILNLTLLPRKNPQFPPATVKTAKVTPQLTNCKVLGG